MAEGRFQLLFLDRGGVISEEFFPRLTTVQARVYRFSREHPRWRGGKNLQDLWVNDLKEGIEYSIDRDYGLVEM